MEIQGAFEVAKIISDTPVRLWARIGKQSGITRAEFMEYFSGKTRAHAVKIRRAWRLDSAIALSSMRQEFRGFHPPQSFRYVGSDKMPKKLGARLELAGRN
jgi:predicted transcriptional regulator